MAIIYQMKRGTAARWREKNPILADGELGIEKDTKMRKVGDGVTPWNELEYLTAANIAPGRGPSTNATMSQASITKEIEDSESRDNNLQLQLNKIVAKGANIGIGVSPSTIFKGVSTSVTITASISGIHEDDRSETTLSIRNVNEVIATVKGTFVVKKDVRLDKQTTYTADAEYRGLVINNGNSATVYAVSPIYIGAGAVYSDVLGVESCKVKEPKRTPAGTYTVTTTAEKNKIFMIIPDNMTIKEVVSGPVNMPYTDEGTQVLNGVTYKVYAGLESAAATITFKITA